jgi:hypothetical protein
MCLRGRGQTTHPNGNTTAPRQSCQLGMREGGAPYTSPFWTVCDVDCEKEVPPSVMWRNSWVMQLVREGKGREGKGCREVNCGSWR